MVTVKERNRIWDAFNTYSVCIRVKWMRWRREKVSAHSLQSLSIFLIQSYVLIVAGGARGFSLMFDCICGSVNSLDELWERSALKSQRLLFLTTVSMWRGPGKEY